MFRRDVADVSVTSCFSMGLPVISAQRPVQRIPNDRFPLNPYGVQEYFLCFATLLFTAIHVAGWNFDSLQLLNDCCGASPHSSCSGSQLRFGCLRLLHRGLDFSDEKDILVHVRQGRVREASKICYAEANLATKAKDDQATIAVGVRDNYPYGRCVRGGKAVLVRRGFRRATERRSECIR
jgi:hypothetical protein